MDTQGGFLISQIKLIGGRLFEKILAEEGVEEFNGAQGKILYVLWQKDEIAIAELSKQTGLANTTLTGMLDRMESTGLIKRAPDKRDRRKTLVRLTEKARGFQEKYNEVSEKTNALYYRGFDEEEIRQLEGYLERILQNLKEELYHE